MLPGYLLRAPRWEQSAVSGLAYPALVAAYLAAQSSSGVGIAVRFGTLGGVGFGAVTGRTAQRERERARAADCPVSPAGWQAASRAANRGPVPTDPRIRDASRRLVTYILDEALRRRRRAVVTYSLLAGLSSVLAVAWSRWWWLAVAVHASFLKLDLAAPRQLRRRVEQLEE